MKEAWWLRRCSVSGLGTDLFGLSDGSHDVLKEIRVFAKLCKRQYTKTVFQMEQVWRDGNEEHKVEYHKEHMGRNEE